MQRYRWFHYNWPESISELAELMRSNAFSHEVKQGFILEKVRTNVVSAKYLVKNEAEETVTDPLTGDVSTFVRVSYDVVSFNLYDSFPSIELIDPPRRLLPFIHGLGALIGEDITIGKVEVDIIQLFEFMSGKLKKLKIVSVDCSNILLSINCDAKLSVCGQEDVKPDVDKLLDGKSYSIDKAKVSYMRPNGTVSNFEISRSGGIRLPEGDVDFILPVIKCQLKTFAPK